MEKGAGRCFPAGALQYEREANPEETEMKLRLNAVAFAAAALALGQGADEFLGTQGDEWDAQKDMALACAGALLAAIWEGRSIPPKDSATASS